MSGLERTSPHRDVRPACQGRLRFVPGEFLPPHIHEEAFATIVLTGGYIEAGDTGRHRARPGDVVLHRSYEYHLDRVELSGTEILVIPLTRENSGQVSGRIPDPDSLVRIGESDPQSAEVALLDQFECRHETEFDWPDELARALRDDPSLNLRGWARANQLSDGSISRGFSQVFGVSARSYRLLQRTHRAIREILATNESFAAIAQNCRFADQAHMSRSVQRVTALSPKQLRVRCLIRSLAGSSSPSAAI
jgi:AraC-like DNA-binding protein